MAIALEYDARLTTSYCCSDNFLYGGYRETEASSLVPVYYDIHEGKAGQLFNLDVDRPFYAAQDAGDLVGGAKHDIKLIAKDLHGEVPSHARKQLIEAHLYWLREFVVV